MKRVITALIALILFIPVNAQYLLEENIQVNSQYLLEDNSSKQKVKKAKEVSESYNFGEDITFNRGYRGFFDFGLGFSMSNAEDLNLDNIMLSTTHGYQIIEDKLFVGAGIGYWNMYNEGGSSLPIFVDARSEYYNFGKWSLFADLKLGYSVLEHKGFYLDPQVGVRYGLNDKLGLDLGIGYTFLKDTGKYYSSGYYYYFNAISYFNIKVGVDF